jgi:hypothetical protein
MLGFWRSGSAPALHAGGRRFKPGKVQFFCIFCMLGRHTSFLHAAWLHGVTEASPARTERRFFSRHRIYWQHSSPPTPGARATARRRGLHARARVRQASRASTAAACSGRAALRAKVAAAEQRGVCVGQRGRRDALRGQRRCTRAARRVRPVRRSLRGEGGRGECRSGPGAGEGAPPPCGAPSARQGAGPGAGGVRATGACFRNLFCESAVSIHRSICLVER